MTSGPAIRNKLKKSGLVEYKRYWKYLRLKADTLFGKRAWIITPEGIVVSDKVVVPAADYKAWLENQPNKKASERAAEVEDDSDKPTFLCDQCTYAGYTKSGLAAHKRRMDH